MTNAEQIALWHRQYQYMKKRLSDIRAGKITQPDTIRSHEVGIEQEAIEEANYAAAKLAKLKIKVTKVT